MFWKLINDDELRTCCVELMMMLARRARDGSSSPSMLAYTAWSPKNTEQHHRVRIVWKYKNHTEERTAMWKSDVRSRRQTDSVHSDSNRRHKSKRSPTFSRRFMIHVLYHPFGCSDCDTV